MKLHLEGQSSSRLVSSFDDNTVVIEGIRYTESLIITPEQVVSRWRPRHSNHLTIGDLQVILALEPELILVGTGNNLQFPAASILKDVIRAGVGIDFMGSRAACRTYNILATEGRDVAAGIIIDDSISIR